MAGFIEDYGLWIALGGVFFAMHWFGMGCCGGHRHTHEGGRPHHPAEETAKTEGINDTNSISHHS
jgi:hypothetical protein